METVASELKAEREKRKIPLAHIAAETRISLHHLESLEDGRYRDMPGGMYNRAFLKAYCEFLKLNVPEMMQRYENELSLASEKPSRTRVHVPSRRRSFSISPILVWGFMLAISATGVYFSRNWITAIFSPYFSHTTPAAPVRYETPPAQAASKPSAAPLQTAEPSGAAQPDSTPPASEQSLPAAPVTPQASSATDTGVPPVNPAEAPGSKTIRIEVGATEKSWVSIECDGAFVLQRNMEPGETQSFEAVEKFQLTVGNAGGVHLKINGKPAKPLGKPGSVVKLLIDRRNLQDFLDQPQARE